MNEKSRISTLLKELRKERTLAAEARHEIALADGPDSEAFIAANERVRKIDFIGKSINALLEKAA